MRTKLKLCAALILGFVGLAHADIAVTPGTGKVVATTSDQGREFQQIVISTIMVNNGSNVPTNVGYATGNSSVPVSIIGGSISNTGFNVNNAPSVSVVNNSTISVVSSTVAVLNAIVPPVMGIINSATSIIASTFTPVYNNASFTIWPGTATGVVVSFEASADSATTWQIIEAVQDNNNILGNTFTVGTATTTWDVEVAGMTNFRVRSTAWTAGFSSVTILVSALSTVPSTNITGSTVTAIQSGLYQVEPGTNTFKANVTGSSVTIQQSQPFQVEPGTNVFRINGTFSATSVTTATYSGTGFAPIGAGIALRVSSTSLPTIANDGAAIPVMGSPLGQLVTTGGVPWGLQFTTYSVTISSSQAGTGNSSGETPMVIGTGVSTFTYLCDCNFANTTSNQGQVIIESPAGTTTNRYAVQLSTVVPNTSVGFGCEDPFFRSASSSSIFIFQTLAVARQNVNMRCRYYQGP